MLLNRAWHPAANQTRERDASLGATHKFGIGASRGYVRSGPSSMIPDRGPTVTRLVSELRFSMLRSFNQFPHACDAHLDGQIMDHPLGQGRRGGHNSLLRLDRHFIGYRKPETSRAGEQHFLA